MTERATQPMPVHMHDFDRGVGNPDPIFEVRVQSLSSAPGQPPGITGVLTHAVDSEGNLWPLVGADPGRVTRCPRCDREVYIPDAAATNAKHACPYRDCLGWLDAKPQLGDFLVEDAPGQVIAGDCYEHHEACHAPKVQGGVPA